MAHVIDQADDHFEWWRLCPARAMLARLTAGFSGFDGICGAVPSLCYCVVDQGPGARLVGAVPVMLGQCVKNRALI